MLIQTYQPEIGVTILVFLFALWLWTIVCIHKGGLIYFGGLSQTPHQPLLKFKVHSA